MEKRNFPPTNGERGADNMNRRRNDELSASSADGLAITREQVSDVYREGTIDGLINDVNGKGGEKDLRIPGDL
ncbi:hypothetical protein BSNK01_06360 [Bacillaceae bacterium]